jgi:hypothetical protein
VECSETTHHVRADMPSSSLVRCPSMFQPLGEMQRHLLAPYPAVGVSTHGYAQITADNDIGTNIDATQRGKSSM